MAGRLAHFPRTLQTTLNDMAGSGHVLARREDHEKRFWIRRDEWRFLMSWSPIGSQSTTEFPRWVDWTAFFAAMARDTRGNTTLHWAALAIDARLVSRLLAAGADARATNAVGATALHYGTGSGSIVRGLLRAGADPNAKSLNGASPLHSAAARPNGYPAVRLLLDAGAGANLSPAPLRPSVTVY